MTDESTVVEETQETEETKETLSARKELFIFWFRMIGWLAAFIGAPATAFSIKFGLFSKSGYQVTTDELGNVTGMNIALNGWGIITILLAVFAIITIIDSVIEAYSKQYSLSKQIFVGIRKRIIPIAIILGICYFLRNCLDQAIFCLWVIGLSQIAAIVLNPLPKWISQKKGEEDYSDLLSCGVKLIKQQLSKHKEDK